MSNMTVRARRAHAMHVAQRGYTAVEVLMAMTLFAIGAAGVIGMQRVTMQGGEDSRRSDVATNIANEWISRLQRDAMYWTEPNTDKPTTINITTNTRWLNMVGGACAAFCNPPMPAVPADGLSPAFDNFGRDLPAGATNARYCVQMRLNWIQSPGPIPGGPFQTTALMRAEVRVYWNRLEEADIGTCAAPPPEVMPTISPFHFVYAATAIRENPKR
jgi:prepilin-type N-terminal cleavage/methylation domain-containing protein